MGWDRSSIFLWIVMMIRPHHWIMQALALTVVSIGVAVATVTDLQFNLFGACMALAWIVPSAINKILWSNLQQQDNWTALAYVVISTQLLKILLAQKDLLMFCDETGWCGRLHQSLCCFCWLWCLGLIPQAFSPSIGTLITQQLFSHLQPLASYFSGLVL